jgi:hypothetical protein
MDWLPNRDCRDAFSQGDSKKDSRSVPDTYARPDNWAFFFIEALGCSGLTNGCGDGNYCPDAGVTRAQMAVFMVRAFDLQ